MSVQRWRRAAFAALGTVILMAGLMLTMVLAMAALSLMPLQLADQHVQATRARLMAEAALEQFRYEYFSAQSQLVNANGIDLSVPPGPPFNMKNRFASPTPVFTPASTELPDSEVTITFDKAHKYYSVDNSLSELPAQGCMDGPTETSVPPFSIDLIINVGQFHYEAVLARVWPYAVFCMSGMNLWGNLQVNGDIAITAADVNAHDYIELGSASGTPSNPPTAVVNGDASILYTRSSLTGAVSNKIPIPSRVIQFPGGDLTGQEVHALLPVDAPLINPTTNTININYPNPTGYATIDPEQPPINALRAKCMRTWVDQAELRLGLPKPVNGKPAIFYETGGKHIDYLTQDLVLPDPNAPPGGPSSYYIHGDLINYLPTFTGKKLNDPSQWQFSQAGIHLDNCVLYVDGNVDLMNNPFTAGGCCSSPMCPPVCCPLPPGCGCGCGCGGCSQCLPPGCCGPCPTASSSASPSLTSTVIGNNATLIVNGTLRVQNGQVSAGDQGFVIMANNVALEAGGTYNGLILALSRLRIEPQSATNRLTINGGIVARGSDTTSTVGPKGKVKSKTTLEKHPLEVFSTTVSYQARYLKGLNCISQMQLKAWRLLP